MGRYWVPYVEPDTFGRGVVGLDIYSGNLISTSATDQISTVEKQDLRIRRQLFLEATSKIFGFKASDLAEGSHGDVVICDVPFSEIGAVKSTCYEKVTGQFSNCSINVENEALRSRDYANLGRARLPKIDLVSAQVVIGTLAFLLSCLGKRPLYLGGTHTMTYPIITATSKIMDDLALVWIDAHTDMYHNEEVVSYDATRFSDANVLARILKANPAIAERTLLVGTRLMNEEYQGIIHRDQIFSMADIEERGIAAIAHDICQRLVGRKIYVSVDMDSVDPAFAPAVNTPVAAGLSSNQILRLINLLCKSMKVHGGDIVELDLVKDALNQTSLLAARIAVELLLGMQKPGD
ncbi:MAG TPA: arginase family protein [Candidatus Angelobacter sp.]|nr:arginase family protein [Candidatus Angelobacter sp.]